MPTTNANLAPRPADPTELDALTHLWHSGWQAAHAAFVPAGLLKLRTAASFETRLLAYGNRLRTAGAIGQPLGFCATKPNEIDQLYVAPQAQGTGLAAALLADGETRLRAEGTRRAHLLCLKENTRAARFYARQGWTDTGLSTEMLDTTEGPYPLDVLRFEKDIA